MDQNKECIQLQSKADLLKPQRKAQKSFQDCLTKILLYGGKVAIDRAVLTITTNNNPAPFTITVPPAAFFQHPSNVQLRNKVLCQA